MGTEIRAPKEKLETEGCGCNDLTFCAPEAAISVKAAGDVFTIEQVVNMQRHVGARYYKDKIIFETLAGSQAVRNLSVPEGLINNQMKRKG